jgi:hypothetical protein
MNNRKLLFPLPRWIAGWFAGPRLPASITLLALGMIATHAAILLAAQPAGYWLDPRQALHQSGSIWLMPGLMARGPWLLLAFALVYLLIAGLLLARLNRSAALALAGMLFFFHFFPIINLLQYASSATIQTGVAIALLLVILYAFITLRPPDPDNPAKGLFRAGRWWAALPALPALLAAGWLVFLIAIVAHSAVLPRTGWQPLATRHLPSARMGMAVAYDTRRERAVLFGGMTTNERRQSVYSAETWEWDGQDWVQVHTDDAPAARKFHSMAYDESRGVMVLYGGENRSGKLSDVWEYDGQQWKKRCPSCNPSARWGAAMVYDPRLKQVVFFGGIGGDKQNDGMWYSEAWAWNGNCWKYQDFKSSAPSTFDPALVYDAAQQRMVAFLDLEYGGTWFWKDDRWTRPDLAPEPPHSRSARMVYDPQYARTLLFGGVEQKISSPYLQISIRHGDTWVLEKDAWRRLDLPFTPPAREDHIAFYDPTRRSMIVFGGQTPNNLLGDMWELPLGNSTPGLPAKEKP